jgi:hypothetical protein
MSQSKARWSAKKTTRQFTSLPYEGNNDFMQLLRKAKCLDADSGRVEKCNFKVKERKLLSFNRFRGLRSPCFGSSEC